ncbi:hypothetical protein D9619_010060 [Psilocybe cf. subviscida]|uniref:Uncharacterized protein n=1 Tax=Psilocybe cf. subviscida TaxID=2480587 RepID=A0A8H5BLD5_9AGAR|nr:hypothetical protein D9619_010060 [Psilocybe cf. subviscida]
MSYSPSRRSTSSVPDHLQAPGTAQARRRTSPVGSLNPPPDGGRSNASRPPSPLRNSYTMDTGTGIDPNANDDSDDDDDSDDPAKWQRSPSPSSSVSHLAASFVQRVNNFVGGIAPKSPAMRSDMELEAEAEMERDRSRREAEAILTREAQQRKLVEDRVLAMLESTKSLPPPPSRSQTTPSPSGSQKEGRWWTAAKNKLTPTKEPLTPAQQVIQDAKAREKDKKGKGKEKEKEWPANAQSKLNDPAFMNLNIPPAPVPRKPVPPSPSSPTPSRPSLSNMAPNLTPSPMRMTESIASSPSREAPPVYAQFNAQGTLDVPGTLLAIAKRFEKLEKWTVGHVRALEERMNDVERWLVDKEKDKDDGTSQNGGGGAAATAKPGAVEGELKFMREEVTELQGRVGALGREMAKMATAPSNLSTGPKAQTASVSTPMQNVASVLVQNHTGSSLTRTPALHTRLSSSSLNDSTSPPLASLNKTPTGTRLPYPQGDYTSPQESFSPPISPPRSLSRTSHRMSIPGIPDSGASSGSFMPSSYSSTSSFGRTMSPSPMSPPSTSRGISPSPSPSGLPPPKAANPRPGSVSPTPRKRYTVALGGPLTAPPDEELRSNAAAEPAPKSAGFRRPALKSQSSTEFFSSSSSISKSKPVPSKADDDDDEDMFADETIGKSAAARLASSANFSLAGKSTTASGDYKSQQQPSSSSPSQSSSSLNRRLRAQSAYGFSSISGASSTSAAAVLNPQTHNQPTPSVAPLRTFPKTRSKSTERLSSGSGDGMVSALGGNTRFVDPLVLRKQSRDSMQSNKIAMPKPAPGKVPIGQLVAFFDKDKDKK